MSEEKRKAYSYIRMSTLQQLKGDSLRRQVKRSEEYARINNLELVEKLEDLGISAFDGKNVDAQVLMTKHEKRAQNPIKGLAPSRCLFLMIECRLIERVLACSWKI